MWAQDSDRPKLQKTEEPLKENKLNQITKKPREELHHFPT